MTTTLIGLTGNQAASTALQWATFVVLVALLAVVGNRSQLRPFDNVGEAA